MHPTNDKSTSMRSRLLAALFLSAFLCLAGFAIFGYWALSAMQSAISQAIPAAVEQLGLQVFAPQKAAVVAKAIGLASPTTGAPPFAALEQFVIWEAFLQPV